MIPVDGVLHAEVKVDLATLLVLTAETKKSSKADALEVQQVGMVAGTCSHFDLLTNGRC